MHEVAISEAVVAGICEHVGDARVTRVVLEIGRLSGVVPDAIRFSFPICAEGTPVEGAELHIVELPALARCAPCDLRFEPEGDPAPCPRCGDWLIEIVNGRELKIQSIEVI